MVEKKKIKMEDMDIENNISSPIVSSSFVEHSTLSKKIDNFFHFLLTNYKNTFEEKLKFLNSLFKILQNLNNNPYDRRFRRIDSRKTFFKQNFTTIDNYDTLFKKIGLKAKPSSSIYEFCPSSHCLNTLPDILKLFQNHLQNFGQKNKTYQNHIFEIVGMGFTISDASYALCECYTPEKAVALLLMKGEKSDFNESMLEELDQEEKKQLAEAKLKEEKESEIIIAQLQKEEEKELEKRRQTLTQQEKADDAYVRVCLREDVMRGKRLQYQQWNFMLMEDHSPGKMYTCMTCMDDFPLEQLLVMDCGHYMCFDDMKQYFETNILSNKSHCMVCPEINCKKLVSFAEVQRCVDSEMLDKYQMFLLENHLKTDPLCRWCPRPRCGMAMIGNPHNPMMVCPNENCRFTFCFNCRVEWHSDSTCDQYQQWKKENAAADDRYQIWAKQNTKPCPQCQAAIEKNGGCNHMTCFSCSYEFCWLCMGKYSSKHFSSSKSSCKGKQIMLIKYHVH